MPPSASQPALTVLCIDDQEEGLSIRKTFLETFGYRVLTATNGTDGIRQAEENEVHAVLLDYRMPQMDGEEVARALRARYQDLPILMLTGYAQELPPGVHELVDSVVTKGSPPAELLDHLRRALGTAPEKPNPAPPPPGMTERVFGLVTDARKHVQRSREHSEHIRSRIPRKQHGK